jgi:demethylspheroidene O-methyltransferase
MPGAATDTLRDRWLHWRNRTLASSRFQRLAAAFPLTRPIARRRASALFDIVAGFVYAQVLMACVRLDVFERLSHGPLSLPELAQQLGLPLPATERLVDAATALQLLERFSAGRVGLGVLGAPMVGNAGIAAMVLHHEALYRDLADPLALLRGEQQRGQREGHVLPTDRLASYWPYASTEAPQQLTGAQVAEYSTLMTASQPLVAGEILSAYPMAQHRCLLDVGGGEGRFLMAAAARAPQLQLQLFDLPAVAERGRHALAQAGLAGRSETHGGSFFSDPLPTGADVATLVRVAHDHDDPRVMQLLRAIHTALQPGGTLLLAEPMSDTEGAQAMGDAYFGFYLLAMGRGQPRTPQRLSQMLQDAGFQRVRLLSNPMPLQTRILVAHKPGAAA